MNEWQNVIFSWVLSNYTNSVINVNYILQTVSWCSDSQIHLFTKIYIRTVYVCVLFSVLIFLVLGVEKRVIMLGLWCMPLQTWQQRKWRENWHQDKKCVWDAFNNPRQRKISTKKASELTFKKPKQEKPDIQSTNLTQDEPVLCFNEDSFRQSLEMCQPSAGRRKGHWACSQSENI